MSKVKVAGIEHIALQHILLKLKGIAYADLTTAEQQILHLALTALRYELILTGEDKAVDYKELPAE